MKKELDKTEPARWGTYNWEDFQQHGSQLCDPTSRSPSELKLWSKNGGKVTFRRILWAIAYSLDINTMKTFDQLFATEEWHPAVMKMVDVEWDPSEKPLGASLYNWTTIPNFKIFLVAL